MKVIEIMGGKKNLSRQFYFSMIRNNMNTKRIHGFDELNSMENKNGIKTYHA